jgi:ABC-type lipoprotein export system ATPase subunit
MHIQGASSMVDKVDSALKDPILCLAAVAVVPGVTALMGPSGAGKSTLMDIMAMRRAGGKQNRQYHWEERVSCEAVHSCSQAGN